MTGATETSGSSFEDRKNGYLSATTPETIENSSAHRRSRSAARSVRSSRSVLTEVDDDSDIAVLGNLNKISRRGTKVVEIKLSRLDCFFGCFFIGKMRRKVAAAINANIIEDDEPEAKGSPWILPVYVVSTKKDSSNRSLQMEAQCTIDTGNLQGNLVSKDFALKLGYTESTFRPLKKSEENGGTSATGHTLMPEGAVHLTWYHSNSTRVFHDMRFLISRHQQCDLVIGARSIEKHKLLCPPNLTGHNGITVFNQHTDDNFLELDTIRAKLANDLKTFEQDLEDAREDGNESKVKKLETKISEVERRLEVAKLKVEQYNAKQTLNKGPTDKGKMVIATQIENDLKEAESKLPKKAEPTLSKGKIPQIVPPVTATETSSAKRTLTLSNLIRRNTRSLEK